MLGFSLPSHYGRTTTAGRSNWSTMNPMRRISARLCRRHILRVMETSRRSRFGPRPSFPNNGSNSYLRRRRPLIAGKKDSSGQRPMERAVTPEISQLFLRRHELSGVNHFGTEVTGIERGRGGGRYTIALAQGKKIETDLVVVGIGVNPNTELAASAGLVVNGGILVDQNLSTSDANISAIGDCVVFPTPPRPSPSGSSLFRMRRIRPAVSPCALSEKVHLIEACRGFGAIKETISYRLPA
jgi:hypothetical protein